MMKRFLLLSISPTAVVIEVISAFLAGYLMAKATIRPVIMNPKLDVRVNGSIIVTNQEAALYFDWTP